jgi:ABC-type polysaccharide/polyol phosphate transport system ATPase subunit
MSSDAVRSSEPAIELRAVSKRYRLYQKPLYRFLDLFDLCPSGPAYYHEHGALSDVSLNVDRGARTAIIGRNGAGKSTLLKIVTGLVQPTTGSVLVRGQISNLLQIGTGFHPDFTGRQNVFASLAHQGIVGRHASQLFEEIVAFAEIHEYIDQPMKTYSTGMCSRLMFSSSIVMSPDILVVDEILGVGDAYFSHKSFNRMRELCSREGTTLLLVTHDIYSALNLCERFIWIDKGRVMFDGDGAGAVALYENSIKEQEEQYLREHNVAALAERVVGDEIVHVLVRSGTGFALPQPLALAEVELTAADGGSQRLAVADETPGWTLQPESSLGKPEVVDGRRARSLQTFGSIFHKAEWVVPLPPGFVVDRARVVWRYQGSDPVDLRVMHTDRKVLVSGELAASADWQDQVFTRAANDVETLDGLSQTDYGTGLVRITAIEFFDRDGREITQIQYGDALTVRVHCRADGPIPDGAVSFHVGFAKPGVANQAYVYNGALRVPPAHDFVIDSRIDHVRLGSGPWFIHAGLGMPNLIERDDAPYFTADSAWYHLLTKRLQLRVLSTSKFDANGMFCAIPASVTVEAITERTPA